jgi:hypothetical protein
MTRRKMTEADWMAVARIFHAIHQRRAAAEAASAPAGDARQERARELAVQNARARREAAAGDGDDDG